MLVQVDDRAVLDGLTPDMDALREECDRFGLLGCYVYSLPSRDERAAARMFAPSIGVQEDIANANSTACMAAHLAERGHDRLEVDMGDALGVPATVTTEVLHTPAGLRVLVGGSATIVS